jgi:hypothetical protein
MYIKEVSTGKTYQIEILPLENSDFKLLSNTQYFFNWNEEDNQEAYKLVLIGQNEIQGLVSIERIPSEWRIHIRLLTVSSENKFFALPFGLPSFYIKSQQLPFTETPRRLAPIPNSPRPKLCSVSIHTMQTKKAVSSQMTVLLPPRLHTLSEHSRHWPATEPGGQRHQAFMHSRDKYRHARYSMTYGILYL